MCVEICLIWDYQSLEHYHCWVACWENDKYLLAHDTMRRKQNPFVVSLYKHGTAWHHSLQNFYKASYIVYNSKTIYYAFEEYDAVLYSHLW